MPRYRNYLKRIVGFPAALLAARTPRHRDDSATSNPGRWWAQTRIAALGYAFAAFIFCLAAVIIDRNGTRLDVAGIPASLLLVSVLLPLGLWALAMWHEAVQQQIGHKNRMDEES